MFPVDEEKYHSLNYTNISNSSKNIFNQKKKNTVSVGRKSVCISRIEDIEKYAFTIRKHGFYF